MLTNYLNRTRLLLQNPSAPQALYDDADLTIWINIARGQLAGEAECIRIHATLDTIANQQSYNFASLDTGVAATVGIQGAIHVSSIRYAVGTGWRWISPKPWPWFTLYELNNPVPQPGPPQLWSQFAQGASPGTSTGSFAGGSFSISPVPDDVDSLTCDTVCYPIPLADDTTVEAIPYLWTDAVPFFAAYYALLSAQNNARMADAERYFNHYTQFVERARTFSNPSVNRWMYRQAQDVVQANKVQAQSKGGIGG